MCKMPKYWDLYLAGFSLTYIIVATRLANISLTASPELSKELATSAFKLLSSPQLLASIYLPFALIEALFLVAGALRGKRYFISAAIWLSLMSIVVAAESFFAHTALSFDSYGPNGDFLVAAVLALLLSCASLSAAAALIWTQKNKT
jgi:hypothetical protein